MSELMTLIKERRSIRKYQDKEVPEEVLEQLLDAARWAPSWTNSQCWEIVVITDPEVKKAIQGTIPEGNPAAKCVASAPLLLALCARLERSGYYKGVCSTKFGDWFMYDLGLATQNIALMAHALGLGSVILGLFLHDEAAKILHLPDGHEIVSLMPIGYPNEVAKIPPRRPIAEFTHQNSF